MHAVKRRIRRARKNVRLNKYLSSSGICSRREADRMIEQGWVTVNGIPAAVGMDVSDDDHVTVDGRGEVHPAGSGIYLAVNKPAGVVVTTDRSHGDRVLEDLVADCGRRVFAVGRLDKDSEGLILMTNDGDISNRIQKARERHEKEYLVRVDRAVTDEFLRGMGSGVRLQELGRTTRPCRVTKSGTDSFDIILTEGMNRQIRRMCACFGYQVVSLKRIRIMNILLGDLACGRYRHLTDEEVGELKRLCGVN